MDFKSDKKKGILHQENAFTKKEILEDTSVRLTERQADILKNSQQTEQFIQLSEEKRVLIQGKDLEFKSRLEDESAFKTENGKIDYRKEERDAIEEEIRKIDKMDGEGDSKAERKKWKSSRISELKERLEELKMNSVKEFYHYVNAVDKTRHQLDIKNPADYLKDMQSQQQQREFKQLFKPNELKKLRNDSAKFEQLKKIETLYKCYLSMNDNKIAEKETFQKVLNQFTNSNIESGTIADLQLKKPFVKNHEIYGRTFLMEAITAALHEALNQMPRNLINESAYLEIYTMTRCSNLLASNLAFSEHFKKEDEEYHKNRSDELTLTIQQVNEMAEKGEKIRQEVEASRIRREDYLKKGYGLQSKTDTREGEWYLGQFADYILQNKGSELDALSNEDYASALEKMNKNCCENRIAILLSLQKKFEKEKKSEQVPMNSPKLLEEMVKQIWDSLGEKVALEQFYQIEQNIDYVMSQKIIPDEFLEKRADEEQTRIKEYANQMKEDLLEGAGAGEKEFLEHTVMPVFLKQSDVFLEYIRTELPAGRKEYIRELKETIVFKTKVLKDYLTEHAGKSVDVYFVYQKIADKCSNMFLPSVAYGNLIAIAENMMNHISVIDANRDSEYLVYQALLKEYNLSEHSDMVDHELRKTELFKNKIYEMKDSAKRELALRTELQNIQDHYVENRKRLDAILMKLPEDVTENQKRIIRNRLEMYMGQESIEEQCGDIEHMADHIADTSTPAAIMSGNQIYRNSLWSALTMVSQTQSVVESRRNLMEKVIQDMIHHGELRLFGLDQSNNYEDLEQLSFRSFQALKDHLVSVIAKNSELLISGFSNQQLGGESLRSWVERVLAEKADTQELTAELNILIQIETEKKQILENKILMEMQKNNLSYENYQYDYLKESVNTQLVKQGKRLENRQKRMLAAERIRGKLLQDGDASRNWGEWMQACSDKKEGDIKSAYEKIQGDCMRLMSEDEEARSYISKGYAKTRELSVMDYFSMIMRENEQEPEEKQIAQLKRNDYEKILLSYSDYAAGQESVILSMIKDWGLPDGADAESVIKAFQPLRYQYYEMLNGSRDESALKENMSEFRSKVEAQFQRIQKLTSEEKARIQEQSQTQKNRVTELSQLGGGMVAPLLPYLLKREDFYTALALKDTSAYDIIKKNLEHNILPIFEKAQHDFGKIPMVMQQIILSYQEQFTEMVPASQLLEMPEEYEDRWYRKFEEVEEKVLRYSITGKDKDSIGERINCFLTGKKYSGIAKYFGAILQAEGGNLAFFESQKSMDKMINKYLPRIEKKEKLRTEFLQEKMKAVANNPEAANQLKAMELEIKWNTEEATLMEENDKRYLDILSQQWELALANRVLEGDKKLVAENRLRELKETKEIVQKRKTEGSALLEEREKHFNKVRQDRNNRISPFLQKNGISSNQIPSAEKQNEFRENYKKKLMSWLKDKEELTIPIWDGMCEYAMVYSDIEKQKAHFRYLMDADAKIRFLTKDKPLDDQTKTEMMHFINIFKKASLPGDITEESAISKDFLMEAMSEYTERKKKVNDFRAMEKKIPHGDNLILEYRDMSHTLCNDMYVLEKDDFLKEAEKYRSYLEKRLIFDEVLEEKLKTMGDDTPNPQLWRRSVRAGIIDYNMSKLLDTSLEVSREGIESDVTQILKDTMIVDAMIQSEQLMDSVSSDSMMSWEITDHGVMNRTQFELLIGKIADEDQQNTMNQVLDTVQKRQIFAMILSMPQLLTNTALHGSMKSSNIDADEEQTQADLRRFISAYIAGDQVEVQIPYSLALETITTMKKEKEVMNQDLFDKAIKIVEVCEQRRVEEIPVNMDKLTDYETILKIQGKEPEKLSEDDLPGTFEMLRNKVIQSVGDNKMSVIKKLTELKNQECSLLIQVLQDRTILDMTQKVSFLDKMGGTIPKAVNQKKRDDMVAQYVLHPELFYERKMDSTTLQRAFMALQSSQVKDDVDLRGIPLSREHLVETAEKRETKYDLDLLSKAIDLVKEMEDKKAKTDAVKQAYSDNMLLHYAQPKAAKLYKSIKDNNRQFTDIASLDAYFIEQAKQENQTALIAGYMMLNENQKSLLIKAMANRDILDISKENIMLDRFGLREREFVNEIERNELLDEYVMYGRVNLEQGDFEQAVRGSLSSQLNDTYDYQKEGTTLSDTVKKNDSIFKAVRDTAVDWKLFTRALQLVNRGENERITLLGNTEIYRSQGDLMHGDSYAQDMSLMRENIHHAGNRVSRFLGRRISSRIKDEISDFAVIQKICNLVLPESVTGEIGKLSIMEEEEDKAGIAGKVNCLNDLIDTVSGVFDEEFRAKKYVDTAMKLVHISDNEKVREMVGDGAKVFNYANHVVQIGDTLAKKHQFANEKEELHQKHTEQDDIDVLDEVKKKQDITEQKLVTYMVGKHRDAMKLSEDQVQLIQSNQLISEVASLIADVGSDLTEWMSGEKTTAKIIRIIVEEAGEIINAIRSYDGDLDRISGYYKIDDAMKTYRAKLKEEKIPLKIESFDNKDKMDFFIQANGFENMTELSTYIGMNMVESILFAASSFNERMTYMKLVSEMVLRNLGMSDLIGQVSADAAQKVFGKIVDGNYS